MGIGVIDWQVQAGKVRLSATALSMHGLDNFDGLYDEHSMNPFQEPP
jgi:hypothetical protein